MSILSSRLVAFVLGLGFVAASPGCVSEPSPPPSRYVGDLAGLERVKRGVWNERWQRPGLDLRAYRGITLGPAQLAEPFDMYGDSYRERDLALLLRKFDQAFVHGFAATGWIVDGPGRQVLEVQPVLTGAQANRPPLDTTDQTILSSARGVGGATMQLTLRDSATGELLVALVARKWGQEFSANFNRNTTWGDVDGAFRFWVRMLRQMLERDGVGREAAGG